MSVTIYTPHSALHLRIKFDPVGCVPPLARSAIDRATPGLAAIFAAKEGDVRIRDELTTQIEWVEMDTVARGHIEASRCPVRPLYPARVNGGPSAAAIGRLHGSAQVRAVGEFRILRGDAERKGIPTPVWTQALGYPGIVHVGSGSITLLPDKLPTPARIDRFCYAHPSLSPKLQVFIGEIGCIGVTKTCRNGANAPRVSGQFALVPDLSSISRYELTSLRNTVKDRLSTRLKSG